VRGVKGNRGGQKCNEIVSGQRIGGSTDKLHRRLSRERPRVKPEKRGRDMDPKLIKRMIDNQIFYGKFSGMAGNKFIFQAKIWR